MTPAIPLSVIVLWRDPREGLAESLRTLEGQVEAARGEVIVVSTRSSEDVDALRRLHPGVRWLRVDPPLTEPRAWEAGVSAARGQMVAFGQARCRFAPGWAEAVLAARGGPDRIVAGPVEPEPGLTLAGRAAYLCDYAAFADPAGQGGGLAASNNIAFDRDALRSLDRGRGLDKATILALGRFRITWAHRMLVRTRAAAAPRADAARRFHRARHYASIRSAKWPRTGRLAAGIGCLALPALLYARLVGDRYLRRHHAGALTLGFPWIASALGIWSLGEMAGYWAGPGASDRSL